MWPAEALGNALVDKRGELFAVRAPFASPGLVREMIPFVRATRPATLSAPLLLAGDGKEVARFLLCVPLPSTRERKEAGAKWLSRRWIIGPSIFLSLFPLDGWPM